MLGGAGSATQDRSCASDIQCNITRTHVTLAPNLPRRMVENKGKSLKETVAATTRWKIAAAPWDRGDDVGVACVDDTSTQASSITKKNK